MSKEFSPLKSRAAKIGVASMAIAGFFTSTGFLGCNDTVSLTDDSVKKIADTIPTPLPAPTADPRLNVMLNDYAQAKANATSTAEAYEAQTAQLHADATVLARHGFTDIYTGTATPEMTGTITPMFSPTPTELAVQTGEMPASVITPAPKNGDQYQLITPDYAPVLMNLPEGFTPDMNLNVSPSIKPKAIGSADFQEIKSITDKDPKADIFNEYLNQERHGFPKLAGYTDGVNDYNQYYNHESAPQLPASSWEVFTGLRVEVPGIGIVEGGKGRAAMVLVINQAEDVYRWQDNSVNVLAGFEGWGRVWDGQKNVDETEKRLTALYAYNLGHGNTDKGFLGQCDQAAQNCDSVTAITVVRTQWGEFNGAPRYQFQLVRAETIPAK